MKRIAGLKSVYEAFLRSRDQRVLRSICEQISVRNIFSIARRLKCIWNLVDHKILRSRLQLRIILNFWRINIFKMKTKLNYPTCYYMYTENKIKKKSNNCGKKRYKLCIECVKVPSQQQQQQAYYKELNGDFCSIDFNIADIGLNRLREVRGCSPSPTRYTHRAKQFLIILRFVNWFINNFTFYREISDN